jgi:hypothetical protein
MTEEKTEKIVEQKALTSGESVAAQADGVVSNTENQSVHSQATAPYKISQKDSTTMESLSDEKIDEIKAKGGFQKFEIVGLDSSDGNLIASKGDKPNEAEKLTPKDGQVLSLNDFLHKYKSPIVDAYEKSLKLKEGQPGKSKVLEDILDRMIHCPWADQIHIKYNSKANNPEYDQKNSTITIKPNDSAEKQIENFSHEGFHSTHQFLSKLYDHGVLRKEDFLDVWMQGELDSMLTEVKVYRQLGHTEQAPRFNYFGSSGEEAYIELDTYLKTHTKEQLINLLQTVQPVGMNARPYGEHYMSFYDSYVKNFNVNKPAVDEYIRKWVASKDSNGKNRQRSDI